MWAQSKVGATLPLINIAVSRENVQKQNINWCSTFQFYNLTQSSKFGIEISKLEWEKQCILSRNSGFKWDFEALWLKKIKEELKLEPDGDPTLGYHPNS